MKTADLMNRKIYMVSIPEIYTTKIPKYYTGVTKSDSPRLNGVAVSVDEFIQKFPEYTPEQGFIPDMVYAPPEQNVATAAKSIADMVDMIFNNITFCLFEPAKKYPEILKILDTYLSELKNVQEYNQNLSTYFKKASEAKMVIQDCYDKYRNAYAIKTTGKRHPDFVDEYATITKQFMSLGD